MNTILPRYAEYKDAGLLWVDQLPAHWQIERGKWLFQKMDRPVLPTHEVVTCFRDGIVTLRKNRRTKGFTEAIQEIGYQGVNKGDLVIHAMDAFAGAIGVSDSEGKCTPVYAICQARGPLYAEYYAYVVREMARRNFILALSRGIRERSTDFRFETFAGLPLPVPPLAEQRAIATFLDAKTRQVARFVRQKRRLIALLQEQKQAIIHRAVTRGLDADVPLKDSGVEWLGEVPAHWEVRRAKQICSAIVDCKNRTPDLILGGDFTVIRTTNVRNGKFDLDGSYTTDEHNYKIWTERGAPKRGDVFFTREAPAGEACLVPDLPGICMGQRMMYLRPDPMQLDSTFLLHSIYGPIVQRYIDLACNGSTVGHLRLGQVSSLPILWCPVEEQKAIVQHIEKESEPIELTIERINREITLIQEYRTRLIADVVTGQVDVSELAAARPALSAYPREEEEEAELLLAAEGGMDEDDTETEQD